MQGLNIDDMLIYYIENTYPDNMKKQLYTSLSLCEMFGMKFYEDELIDMLSNNDLFDKMDLQDTLFNKIELKIINILKEHQIELDPHEQKTLEEINDIANFIYLFNNLISYNSVKYRLNAFDEPKTIFIDCLSEFSLIDKIRYHMIIASVSPQLIESMKKMADEKDEDTDDILNDVYVKNYQYFLQFIGENQCLGKTLYDEGYVNIRMTDLINLSKVSIRDTIQGNLTSNIAQSAVDILSVILLGVDSFEAPLIYFNKNVELFLDNSEKTIALNSIMQNMLIDFNTFVVQLKKGFQEV